MWKKNFWISLLILALILMLAACNGNDQANKEIESENKETTDTRLFETVKGEVEIPVNPQRIVTDFYAGEVLAVGGNLVGADSDAFSHPFIQDQLNDVTDLGTPMNVEKMVELNPDLIITMYEDHYEEYSKIAPTLYIPWNTDADIYETLTLFGDITGNEEEAKAFSEEYDEIVAAAKEQLKDEVDENTTVGIYELTADGKLWVFGKNFGRGGQVLYDAFDLKAPEKIQTDIMEGDGYAEISMEVFPEYAADYMFMTVYDPENTGTALNQLQNMSIYQNLDAVKNDTFFINDFDQFYRYDPIAIREQVTLFTELLLEKAESTS
ncbi:iron-hydroxamate ABC transporter substrate-binding protein [Aliibacillus thermotolerans]|uniref:Iron-hydroxamate ABC transporter substrate-binding protein n=1 Tax=Aliibacillus thermotolerans TaxID=1834418 RepID=A0ABW0U5H1_9BACI|nr:iron-hydroxamate ABC transporter substrate-binding protein [Aliibacillus thermotolerans]MDA3129431.1 ABC transporter substrate-binding protein [Aliibacillus thermotolerans]